MDTTTVDTLIIPNLAKIMYAICDILICLCLISFVCKFTKKPETQYFGGNIMDCTLHVCARLPKTDLIFPVLSWELDSPIILDWI